MILLGHISDTHLDGTERATERTRRVMDYLRGLPRPLDALLVTGDIADHGAIAEYQEAAEQLNAAFPVLICPGNHDVRGPYRKGLLDEPAEDGPINRVHHVGGVAILMCDSSIPGRNEGRLDTETLAWIDTTLDGLGDVPAYLAFHHSPVKLYHPLHDSMYLLEPDSLAAVIETHPNIAAIFVGHAHTAAASTFAGRPLLVAPGVINTLLMPWESDAVTSLTQPPGIAFHVIDGQTLVTHYRVVL